VDQPPLSGDFQAVITEDNPQNPYVLASFRAPFWEAEPISQPFSYNWFFVTQRGSISFVAEQARVSTLDQFYMPRDFSGNIQELYVRVADADGQAYTRSWPTLWVSAFSSDLCPNGIGSACQLIVTQKFFSHFQRIVRNNINSHLPNSLLNHELALAQSRKNLDQIVQLYNVVYDFLNQQLPTKNINCTNFKTYLSSHSLTPSTFRENIASLVSQLTGLRNQLYNDLVTGLVIPNSSEGIALKVRSSSLMDQTCSNQINLLFQAHLALGLTEVPEQITAPLAKDVLDFVLTLVNLADSSTLGVIPCLPKKCKTYLV